MQAAPTPSHAETLANATFQAALWALSRPGQVKTLPLSGETGLIAALLDRECQVYCTPPELREPLQQTGARMADITNADHVFLGDMDTAQPLSQVAIGTDLYPDAGATVILRAQIGTGPRLRLTGPGIDQAIDVALDGLAPGIWDIRAQRIRYPMGFDLFFIDGDRIVGIPRSTKIEVL